MFTIENFNRHSSASRPDDRQKAVIASTRMDLAVEEAPQRPSFSKPCKNPD